MLWARAALVIVGAEGVLPTTEGSLEQLERMVTAAMAMIVNAFFILRCRGCFCSPFANLNSYERR